MNETVQSNIKDIIDKNDVVLFMKGTKAQPQCGFSNAVVNTLSFMNIDYKDVNILESDELAKASRTLLTGQQYLNSILKVSSLEAVTLF